MDTTNAARQMIAYQRQAFDNLQKIWDTAQTQTIDAIDRMLDQAVWMPPEGRRAIENWHQSMRDGRKGFGAYVDQSFDFYEKMLNPSPAPGTAPTAN